MSSSHTDSDTARLFYFLLKYCRNNVYYSLFTCCIGLSLQEDIWQWLLYVQYSFMSFSITVYILFIYSNYKSTVFAKNQILLMKIACDSDGSIEIACDSNGLMKKLVL